MWTIGAFPGRLRPVSSQRRRVGIHRSGLKVFEKHQGLPYLVMLLLAVLQEYQQEVAEKKIPQCQAQARPIWDPE